MTHTVPRWTHAASLQDADGVLFQVWAPASKRVSVRLRPGTRDESRVELEPSGHGRHERVIEAPADVEYVYVLDDGESRADPASRWQPRGVHGASRVVDPASFAWSDEAWCGVELADLVVYELHVGTFTAAGTFDAVLDHAARLRDLGVTAVELMPISEFPGRRNWGYDGVFPYAPQSTYGGPPALARLVDGLHAAGLAVFLDVVHNHLGPEGNVLAAFGPYFTDRYRTPWGDALNFDGSQSDHVRSYFIESALQWIADYHIDGLRLDAVHAICDFGARPYLAELTDAVHALGHGLGRRLHVFAESDRNDPRVVVNTSAFGLGFDGVWNDDFHHAAHAVLTGERTGYYVDFGTISHVAKALHSGFVHEGGYSEYRHRRHGAPSDRIAAEQFVVFVQNHDQIGNRARGDRLSSLVSLAHLRLAAGVLLLSPYVPLLFMGEEYGEDAPFLYFVDHGDAELLQAVRAGRRSEFASFGWSGELPDPAALETFERSRIDPSRSREPERRGLVALYKDLLRSRRELPALRPGAGARDIDHDEDEGWVAARYHGRVQGDALLVGWNFSTQPRRVCRFAADAEGFRMTLCTSAGRYGGTQSDEELIAAGRSMVVPPLSACLWRTATSAESAVCRAGGEAVR